MQKLVEKDINGFSCKPVIEKTAESLGTEYILYKYWTRWRAYIHSAYLKRTLAARRIVCQTKIKNFLVNVCSYKDLLATNDESSAKQNKNARRINIEAQNNISSVLTAAVVIESEHGPCSGLVSTNANKDIKWKCSGLFQNRFEVQKEIIAKQKFQLEMQRKIIESMKLEKLKKDMETSANLAEHKLKKKCVLSRDISVKIKQKMLNDGSSPPLFSRGEPKIQEREGYLLKRSRQSFTEELKGQPSKQEEQIKGDHEEKQILLDEEHEKHHMKVESDKIIQTAHNKEQLAAQHYNKKLQKYGFCKLKKAVTCLHEKIVMINEYYHTKILVKHFYEWLAVVQDEVNQKKTLAEEYYKVQMQRKGFTAFLTNWQACHLKEQVASDICDLHLLQRSFTGWKDYTKRQRSLLEKCEFQSTYFCNRKYLTKAFWAWKQLPGILKSEKEKEQRKNVWRKKVREMLPDFCPSVLEGTY